MKKGLLLAVKILVSVVLVWWLVVRVDWGEVGAQVSAISLPFLFLYVVFQLLGNLISAKKWQSIAGYKGLSFSVQEGFYTYLTGAFINNFLPSTIGGDAYRSLWLAKHSGAKAAALSTVVFDRFIGLWTTMFLALCLSPVLFSFTKTSQPFVWVFAALFLFVAVNLIITSVFCQSWLHRSIVYMPFQKIRRLLTEMIFYTKKHIWWRTSLWSVLFAFVGIALANFMLFRAVGSDIGLVLFLSVIFLVTIIASIPLSINNIGIKEWAYVTFFGLLGVSVETAVTVALLSRFIQMAISCIALPQFLRTRGGDRWF